MSQPLTAFLKGNPKSTRKFSAMPASSKDTDYIKIAAYGKVATGKTDAIVALLLRGLRVFVLSTDMGGSGLRTVRSHLRKLGREDLLANLVEHEIIDRDNAYEEVGDLIDMFKFRESAANYEIKLDDGSTTTLFAWDPHVLVWEGFSNYQDSCVVRYVLSKDQTPDKIDSRGNLLPKSEGSEMRRAGFRLDDFRDWDAVKRATNQQLDDFLVIHNPLTGRKIHKYVTFHEKEPDLDNKTGEGPRKPEDMKPNLLLSGSARSTVVGGFDLVIRMTKEPLTILDKQKGDRNPYRYTLNSNDSANKVRGYDDLPDTMSADFGRVWDIINGAEAATA